MAYIQKRSQSDGTVSYRARIRINSAPEMSETFSSKKKAQDWAARMESEIRSGRYFGREELKERTFEEFVDRYIETELPKNPKSQQKLTMQLHWWKKHLQKYYLCHITPIMIAELKEKLLSEITPRHRQRSGSTSNRYMAALSKAFTVAVREWGWLKENPILKVKRCKEGSSRERYLSKEEIARLLQACRKSKSPHLYPVTLFALCSGARKGEIVNLTWKDIDFSRKTATFRDTKNGEIRTVPLSQTLLDCLSLERKKRVVLSEYVFPSMDGKSPADIRTAWDIAVAEVGLRNVCFHTLRHTAASHLCMGGASTLEIAAILGHKTLSMVKRYSHLSVTATAKVLDRMNGDILGVG